MSKTYLGDCVYAEFDGHRVMLYTDDGYGPKNIIFLEEGVYYALVKFVDSLKEATK